jgi:hypothetical protein
VTITPAGLPAWSRSADHTYYGGHPNKANYQSQGVVNPRTDVGAEAITRFSADLAATVNTSPFAILTYLNDDAGPSAPTIESAHMMTGVRTTSYEGDAAPTGFPSAARNGNGDVTFTFAATYMDPYGVEHAFTPTHVTFGFHGTAFLDATYVISGSTIRIRCWDASAGALSNRRITIVVH